MTITNKSENNNYLVISYEILKYYMYIWRSIRLQIGLISDL